MLCDTTRLSVREKEKLSVCLSVVSSQQHARTITRSIAAFYTAAAVMDVTDWCACGCAFSSSTCPHFDGDHERLAPSHPASTWSVDRRRYRSPQHHPSIRHVPSRRPTFTVFYQGNCVLEKCFIRTLKLGLLRSVFIVIAFRRRRRRNWSEYCE